MKGHIKFALYVLVVIAVSAFVIKMIPGLRDRVAPFLTF